MYLAGYVARDMLTFLKMYYDMILCTPRSIHNYEKDSPVVVPVPPRLHP